MQSVLIAFLAGGLFVGLISYYLSRMVMRAEVIEMINEQTYEQIKDLEFKLSYLEKKNYILKREKNTAITDAKQALDERNEAMLMLSTKLTTNGD